jgi:hypothetical protein
MKRMVALAGVIVVGLIVAVVAYVGQSKVPPEAIQTCVTQTEALLDHAWRLPVAAAFGRTLSWRSNGSVCGRASLANVFRSLGEEADTEGEVLQGTYACWFHVCPIRLTPDQMTDLARLHSSRTVTVHLGRISLDEPEGMELPQRQRQYA